MHYIARGIYYQWQMKMFKNQQSSAFPELCQKLGYQFNNKELLITALTRKAAQIEGKQLPSIGHYQRLEFLGDKVIGLAIADILYDLYPDWQEGQLTQATSHYVNNTTALPEIGRHLNLDKYIITGHGEELQGIQCQPKALADAVEALFGAIFLDCEKNHVTIRNLVKTHWKILGLLDTANKTPPTLTHFITAIDEADKLLEKALLENDTSAVNSALIKGANPNITLKLRRPNWPPDSFLFCDITTCKTSALMIAILNRNSEAMQYLLQFGADPNWSHTQLTLMPQHKTKNVPLADLLHPKITTTTPQKTPLHVLVELAPVHTFSISKAIQLLIAYQANIKAVDSQGKTPAKIYSTGKRVNELDKTILALLQPADPEQKKLAAVKKQGLNNLRHNTVHGLMSDIFSNEGEDFASDTAESLLNAKFF